jgi:hypothetical protein
MRIVAFTNQGQLPMMKNMLNSALKSGYPMNLFHCYIESDGNPATYATQEFQSVTLKKLEIIRMNMSQDREVLWIDNDIFLFQNVLDELRGTRGQFVMQDDLWGPCTGFFLARSSPNTVKVIDTAIDWLRSNKNPMLNDQHAFHHAMKHAIVFPRPALTLLSQDEYPNGQIYFNEGRKSRAKIVHSNYLRTTAEKVVRFKEFGLWDESDTAFLMVNRYSV